MQLIINGINGKMGKNLIAACNAQGVEIVAGIDKVLDAETVYPFPVFDDISKFEGQADGIIDFSRPEALSSILGYAVKKKIPTVVATTGFDEAQKAYIQECAQKIPVFFSANMSLGVNLQLELAKTAAAFLGQNFDIEIIEKHHKMKVDAPSGTALLLADGINSVFNDEKVYEYGRHTKTEKRKPEEIGIHAIRGGTIVGEHQILFIGDNEVLEITHKAESRMVFANGAIRAAAFLLGKEPGLYNMSDIVRG